MAAAVEVVLERNSTTGSAFPLYLDGEEMGMTSTGGWQYVTEDVVRKHPQITEALRVQQTLPAAWASLYVHR